MNQGLSSRRRLLFSVWCLNIFMNRIFYICIYMDYGWLYPGVALNWLSTLYIYWSTWSTPAWLLITLYTIFTTKILTGLTSWFTSRWEEGSQGGMGEGRRKIGEGTKQKNKGIESLAQTLIFILCTFLTKCHRTSTFKTMNSVR